MFEIIDVVVRYCGVDEPGALLLNCDSCDELLCILVLFRSVVDVLSLLLLYMLAFMLLFSSLYFMLLFIFNKFEFEAELSAFATTMAAACNCGLFIILLGLPVDNLRDGGGVVTFWVPGS